MTSELFFAGWPDGGIPACSRLAPPASRGAGRGRVTSTEQGRRKYDELADRYEEVFPYVADVGKLLVDHASPPPGARVLDVGAGRGAVARAALSRGCVVTAVDASMG